jgi:FrmR/RcnR family transcriptional regulator, repressor of rcnA expression
MAHTKREKAKLLNRVRRIRGQVEAAERALEDEAGCAAVLQIVVSIRGAISGLMAELVEDHIRLHVADQALDQRLRSEGAEELVDIVRAYLK